MKKVAVGLLTILPVADVGVSLRSFAGRCSVPEAIAAEILFASDFQVPETMELPADAVVRSSPIYRSNLTSLKRI